MHGIEQWKLRLGVRRSGGTVRKEFNRDSESAGKQCKKRKEKKNHNTEGQGQHEKI